MMYVGLFFFLGGGHLDTPCLLWHAPQASRRAIFRRALHKQRSSRNILSVDLVCERCLVCSRLVSLVYID